MAKNHKETPEHPKPVNGYKSIVFGIFFIGIASTINALNPFGLMLGNIAYTLTLSIPLLVCAMMLMMPFAIWHSFEINDLTLKFKKKKIAHLKSLTEIGKTISFRVFYEYAPSKKSSGSKWILYNNGAEPWKKAKLFLECEVNGTKTTETHTLDYVSNLQPLYLNSKLSISPSASWRVMILTGRGHKISYPAMWNQHEYKKKEL